MSYDEASPAYDPPDRQLTRSGRGHTLGKRQAAVSEQLERLDTLIDRAAEELTPVLGPERPSPALAGGGSSDEPGSDLGRALEHYSERLSVLNGRLSYLLDRLDL